MTIMTKQGHSGMVKEARSCVAVMFWQGGRLVNFEDVAELYKSGQLDPSKSDCDYNPTSALIDPTTCPLCSGTMVECRGCRYAYHTDEYAVGEAGLCMWCYLVDQHPN